MEWAPVEHRHHLAFELGPLRLAVPRGILPGDLDTILNLLGRDAVLVLRALLTVGGHDRPVGLYLPLLVVLVGPLTEQNELYREPLALLRVDRKRNCVGPGGLAVSPFELDADCPAVVIVGRAKFTAVAAVEIPLELVVARDIDRVTVDVVAARIATGVRTGVERVHDIDLSRDVPVGDADTPRFL
jgi:hypothetical protein